MLLWTGYGPLQEGDQLWGRVFKALLQPPSICPESRFFQLARCGSLQTWYLSNIILAHLVYRPVTNIMSDSNALHDPYIIYIAFWIWQFFSQMHLLHDTVFGEPRSGGCNYLPHAQLSLGRVRISQGQRTLMWNAFLNCSHIHARSSDSPGTKHQV